MRAIISCSPIGKIENGGITLYIDEEDEPRSWLVDFIIRSSDPGVHPFQRRPWPSIPQGEGLELLHSP